MGGGGGVASIRHGEFIRNLTAWGTFVRQEMFI